MFSRLVLALALLAGSATADMHLTADNYDAMTSGQSVFLKFYAPWCGHCKKLAPDWKKLMDENRGGDSGKLVAHVDCTADGKPLCDANGVKGFPSLKYGDPNDLQDYKGGRDLKSLKKHVADELGPSCGPANLDLCDDATKAEIAKYQAMDSAELAALVKGKEEELEKAETEFKAGVEELQATYEALQKGKEDKLEEIKQSGLGLMKQVSSHAAKATKDEL